MRRTLVAVAATTALLLTACGDTTEPAEGVEVEDCDAEDFANREKECGFSSGTKKPTKKPTSKATTKPAPAKPKPPASKPKPPAPKRK